MSTLHDGWNANNCKENASQKKCTVRNKSWVGYCNSSIAAVQHEAFTGDTGDEDVAKVGQLAKVYNTTF